MRKALVAVGIGLLLGVCFIAFNTAVARADDCMSASDTETWGVWPYEQYVTDHTYFCWGWQDGKKAITYRTDSVTAHGNNTGGLCDATGTKHWLIGENAFYRDWTVEGDFFCPTDIPYVNLHPSDKFNVWVNATGTYCGPSTKIGPDC